MRTHTVAFVGTIGFIGLVGPHIARMMVGEDQRFLLPASALLGGGEPDTYAECVALGRLGWCALAVGTGQAVLDYVIGYSIGLDMTARGPEDRSFRKSIDTYSVLGPWLVTADEIPDPDDVALSISVNGETKQSSSTKQLIYDCRKLIEWGSTFYTFYPGDVLYTGTPEGVSPVKPGDTMVARIDPIGEMRVSVRAHQVGG